MRISSLEMPWYFLNIKRKMAPFNKWPLDCQHSGLVPGKELKTIVYLFSGRVGGGLGWEPGSTWPSARLRLGSVTTSQCTQLLRRASPKPSHPPPTTPLPTHNTHHTASRTSQPDPHDIRGFLDQLGLSQCSSPSCTSPGIPGVVTSPLFLSLRV